MTVYAIMQRIAKLRPFWHLNDDNVVLDKYTFRFILYLSLDSSVGRAEDCSWNKSEQISLGHWFESGSRD